MPEVRFVDVHKRFGQVDALDGLNLRVEDGELLTVLGPSGCGKTTMLRVVAGLETVSSGRVLIGERDVTAVHPARRNIAMVFQNHALFPHLTVAENIGFGLVARRETIVATRRMVQEAAAVVGCVELLGRKPAELSGGERQRVALARALVRRPDAFLLDEPLSNLDAPVRVAMRVELRRLHREVGGSMIYVTHDQVEALTLGDRIAVMGGGAVQQVGTPDEIYQRPASRFVAQFVGSPPMNVLDAEIVGESVCAGPFVVPAPRVPTAAAFQIGVRPEHVRLVPDAQGVPAVVHDVEIAGCDAYVYLGTGQHDLVARTDASQRPARGERVAIEVPPERCHLFDATTGITLWPDA